MHERNYNEGCNKVDKKVIGIKMQQEYICPKCKSELDQQKNQYACKSCAALWPVINGIPVFSEGDIPYWSEIKEEDSNAMNDYARKHGYKVAINKFMRAESREIILAKSRINWKYLVESDIKGKVLDIGCGWGGLAFGFADEGEKVYALESVRERIEFVEIRRAEEKINNLMPLCGNGLKLPFKDAFFDMVILNGVLEWIGLSDLSRTTEQVQIALLQEIKRV
ncbi:MAG: class I SAM-dependent methyltransferase, partial [bacterium]